MGLGIAMSQAEHTATPAHEYKETRVHIQTVKQSHTVPACVRGSQPNFLSTVCTLGPSVTPPTSCQTGGVASRYFRKSRYPRACGWVYVEGSREIVRALTEVGLVRMRRWGERGGGDFGQPWSLCYTPLSLTSLLPSLPQSQLSHLSSQLTYCTTHTHTPNNQQLKLETVADCVCR